MKNTANVLIGLGLALCAGGALGQTSWRMNCISSGSGAPEPVGEGHAFWVAAAACVEEGGPLGSNAVATQNTIWENFKGAGTILSGDGVGRSPNGAIAYRQNGGTMKVLMQDGRPVGWEASGSGVWTLATGAAAPFKGKTFAWTAKPTGPRTYVIDVKVN
ncbi:MAG: hypothetical protein HY854_05440 [Burkholderiales bacterium]|nr:hypothetical protein [Burkholderiales bacterium]